MSGPRRIVMIVSLGLVLPLGLVLSLVLVLSGAEAETDHSPPAGESKPIQSVEFTDTPPPSNDADRVRTYTSSRVRVLYADGSRKEFPLEYNVLFNSFDRVGGNPHEAGRSYDVNGRPLVDPNGDPVIAETPDANSLLRVGSKVFLVTHYEYDWRLGNGEPVLRVQGWHIRMPSTMSLTELKQDPSRGLLGVVSQRTIDFSSVNGLWIPCFGSQTPWNTHLGSEEDYDLFYIPADGTAPYQTTTNGLRALEELYFNGERKPNPYHYGYITEVEVDEDGSTHVTKHYNLGRATWEMAKIMPDGKTVYFGDDGNHVGLFLFVSDRVNDLSSGGLYAARWTQVSGRDCGVGTLGWVKLGSATNEQIKALIDSGITFSDIFDVATRRNASSEFKPIRAGGSTTEVLRLKKGREVAAAFLEPRRYAAYRGATTEFNKMEGVAVNAADRVVYIAMSYIMGGMQRDPDAPADHLQVERALTGGIFALEVAGGTKDTDGNPIDSDWVGFSMRVPKPLLGEDIRPDSLGNKADPDKVSNPDNVFFSEKMRTLFIGEDSPMHVNNFLWAYNVDTKKLVRILSLAAGGELTGLQVVEDLDGFAYIMSNIQHQGEWKSEASRVRAIREIEKDKKNRWKGDVKNYYLEAPIGYLSGIPGLH